MRNFHRAASIGAVLAVLLPFHMAPSAIASIEIDDVELLERTRVGRTTFNYTYRVHATNTAPVGLTNAVAYLSQAQNGQNDDGSSSENDKSGPTGMADFGGFGGQHQGPINGTLLLDDVVVLGDLAAGESVVSVDTFTIQQDRTFQLDTESLFWEVGYTAVVTVSGVVRDQPISFAEVELIVDRGESGRPIIESGRPIIETYEAVADEEGRYSVDVDFVADADFVSITGDGVNDLAFVALRSVAGSAGSLLDEATEETPPGGDPMLRVSGEDADPLNVTHISTALVALALEANGGNEFTNDEDLAAAQAQVDNNELVITAAVLKAVIDNDNIDLPPGAATTEDLLANPDLFNDFVETLEEDFPDEFNAAVEETIDDLSVGYVSEELPDTLYLARIEQNPLVRAGDVFTFDQGGSATHIDFVGETTDASWVIDANGNIVVTLNNPPTQEFFESREVPPGSGNVQQVRALSSTIEFLIVRVTAGIQSDQVLRGSTRLTTFPDNAGVLPDEILVLDPDPANARLATGDDNLLAYTAGDLIGSPIEFNYYHTDNASVGLIDTRRGADLFTFNSDGTGQTARRQFTFDWSIDAAGRLDVVFANGDSNQYARYTRFDQGLVDRALMTSRFGASEVQAVDTLIVTPGGIDEFDEPVLEQRRFRSGGFIVDPTGLFGGSEGDIFDFVFLNDGTGCRLSTFLRPFTWEISEAGYMELSWVVGNPPFFARQRSWQAVALVPGVLGPRHWLIENLDSADDPSLLTDPTMTPGRTNFYEDLGLVPSINTPPSAVTIDAMTTTNVPIFVDIVAANTDPDGNEMFVQSLSGASLGGSVVFQTNGFTYTPPQDVSGIVDTITYILGDDVCALGAVGTVNVTVSAAASTIQYDESFDGDIEGEYGLGPVFQLAVGSNVIAGVGNGPVADPPTAPFDFDVFSIVLPPDTELTSITLDGWGTQEQASLFMRVRPGVQPPDPFQWSVIGGFDVISGQQATPQSIAADVAAIPLTFSEYTFNNSGSTFDPGIPYQWTFVVEEIGPGQRRERHE